MDPLAVAAIGGSLAVAAAVAWAAPWFTPRFPQPAETVDVTAHDNTALSAAIEGTTTPTLAAFTVASGTDRVLFVNVGVHIQSADAAVTGVTFNGDALTQFATADEGTRVRQTVWRLVAPDETSGDVVVTLDQAAPTRIVARSYSGVDQSTPNRTVATDTGNSATWTPAATSVSGDVVVDATFTDGDRTVSFSQGQTARGGPSATDPLSSAAGELTASGTTTTMGGGISPTDQHASTAFAIVEAAGPAVGRVNVSWVEWTYPEAPPGVSGTATGTVTTSGVASGVATFDGVGDGAVAVFGSGDATGVIIGTADGTVATSGTASGVATYDGVGDGTVAVTGAATGESGGGTLDFSVVGGLRSTSVMVNARLSDAASAVLKCATDSGLTTGVVTSSSENPDGNGHVSFTLGGLTAETDYHYGVEVDGQTSDAGLRGQFTTPAVEGTPYSFSFAHASCMNSAGSSATTNVINRVFDDDPLFFAFVGDFDYDDNTSAAAMRTSYAGQIGSGSVALWLRTLPFEYGYSDHDFLGNNVSGDQSGTTQTQRLSRSSVVRDYFPLRDEWDTATTDGAIGRAWHVGRVLFVFPDERYYKSANSATDNSSKVMWGSAQRTWFSGVLAATDAELLVVFHDTPWHDTASTTTDDHWVSYQTERETIADIIDAAGFTSRTVHIGGDMHGLGAADDSAGTDYTSGGATGPLVLQAAAIQEGGSTKGGPYRLAQTGGTTQSSGGQQRYGLATVTDDGSTVTFSWGGYTAGPSVSTLVIPTDGNPVELVVETGATGTASGTVSTSGVASGVSTFDGAGDGTVTTSAVTSGVSTYDGTGDGTVATSGTVSGVAVVLGSTGGGWATDPWGSTSWGGGERVATTGTASGVSGGDVDGTASGTVSTSGVASGVSTFDGTASGAVSVTGDGAGVATFDGTADGAATVTGTAVGQSGATGTADGTVATSGSASGIVAVTGAAASTIAATAVASGVVITLGQAVGMAATTGQATAQSPLDLATFLDTTRRWDRFTGTIRPDRFTDTTLRDRFTDTTLRDRFTASTRYDRVTGTVRFDRATGTIRYQRVRTTRIYREDADVALNIVALGDFTQGEIPEGLLIQWVRTHNDETTSGLPLFNQTPAYTVTGKLEQPDGTIVTRACTILDPDQLSTLYPDEPQVAPFVDGTDGWVLFEFDDGDLDQLATDPALYNVALVAARSTTPPLRLKTSDVWRLSVNDSPAAAVGA